MDNQFNMNDMPKRIFTENSYFSQECSSLSSDNNSMNIAMESASSVIHKMNDNDSMSVLDEMKSMIKETEKTISKNILMEMYAFKTRHDGIGITNEDHPFMTCKYTNLTSTNIPNLDILMTVLKEVYHRVSKFQNHYNPYDKDDFKDTLKDLMDMIRDRSENISGCVLGFNKHIDPHDFIEEMYLLYRSGNEYSVQEHSGDEYKSYEDEINECYLGIGNSVESYNSKLIACLSLFNDVMRLLSDKSTFSELNGLKADLKEDVEVFTLRYLFIANIAYAGKADAVKDYLNPGNADIKYGAHITNDEPLDLELDFDLSDDDFTDDDDVEDMDFDLLEDDDVIVESAFDKIDIRENYVPEYTQSPELYVLEAQMVKIINEELMAIYEAGVKKRTKQLRKAIKKKNPAMAQALDEYSKSKEGKDQAERLKQRADEIRNGKPADPNKPGYDVEYKKMYEDWKSKQNKSADTSDQKFFEANKNQINTLRNKYGMTNINTYNGKPAETGNPAEQDTGAKPKPTPNAKKYAQGFRDFLKNDKKITDIKSLSEDQLEKYNNEFMNSEKGKMVLKEIKDEYIKNGGTEADWANEEKQMKGNNAEQQQTTQQQTNQQQNTEEEKKKKDKKEKERGIFEEIWHNIKKFLDKMLVRFSSAAGKYSADARSYVLDDIYNTYSKSDANQAPNLYPQFEGDYNKSVMRVKSIFDQIKNVSFTNKNIFDADNMNTNYNQKYFVDKILPGNDYDPNKTSLADFCKSYFRGGDANSPIKLTNFGPGVPKDTFAAMIDLQLSAEMTSNQLAKNINAMVADADKFTQKFIRDYKQEAAMPEIVKDHIASVLEEYFDDENYKAYNEEDQQQQPAQGGQDQQQQNTEEPAKIKKLRESLKNYQEVLMNVMASACTTYEVLCNRNKRILKCLQTGDPIKNSKEKNNANVEPNKPVEQQQTQQQNQQQQQPAQPQQQPVQQQQGQGQQQQQ